MLTANDISQRVRVRPFIPLRIVTSSGQSYDITHPDLIMVGRRDLIVGTSSEEEPGHYEQVSRASIMHVTALENCP
jgi:hypothetical protein